MSLVFLGSSHWSQLGTFGPTGVGVCNRQVRQARIRRDFRSTLVHELGHAGDGSRCDALLEEPYGPDGEHYLDEVLPPTRAFQEGWANYLEARYLVSRGLEVGWELSSPPPFLEGTSGNVVLPATDLPVLMTVEGSIATFLRKLGEAIGHEKLEGAFLRTTSTNCRTLATLLGDLVKKEPGLRPQVEASLRALLTQPPSEDDRRAVLDRGELPACMEPGAVPFVRPAVSKEGSVFPERGRQGPCRQVCQPWARGVQ